MGKESKHGSLVEDPEARLDKGNDEMRLDIKRDHFPLSIVWSPIPMLSWMIPVVGHLGIVTSEGVIHDFAGPYFINVCCGSQSSLRILRKITIKRALEALSSELIISSNGHQARYYRVESKQIRNFNGYSDPISAWDNAIEQSSKDYEGMMHNIIFNNCHAHVARALNKVEFYGFTHWNTLTLILFMMFQSRFVSIPRFLKAYFFFLCFVAIVLGISLYSRVFS